MTQVTFVEDDYLGNLTTKDEVHLIDVFKMINTNATDAETRVAVLEGGSGAGLASAHLSSSIDQVIAIVDTSQVVAFNTHDDAPLNLTHSVSTNNDRVQFVNTGRYAVTLSAEVYSSGGNTTLFMWMEESTDGGSTWTNVANSGSRVEATSKLENVLVIHELYDVVTTGNMIRFRTQGNSTNLSLEHTAASGDIPAVPSVMMTIYEVGPSSIA